MAKAKKETKKKITLKNFKDYALEQLSEADSKGITLISSSLLVEVEEKFDNESDFSFIDMSSGSSFDRLQNIFMILLASILIPILFHLFNNKNRRIKNTGGE